MTGVLRRHPVLTTAFALALGLTLFFAGQFIARAVYWSNPAHLEQQVQPWMTAGYIGRSWGLDPRALVAEAGLPPRDGRPLTLDQIAEARGVPVGTVIAEVEAALLRLRAQGAADQ
ncbi:MAG: hypothetical protein IPL38_18605 [Rhodobacter sp.]|jgi:hypothetical protein|nr:hypothetical protein [Rhodobacter sp.]MBK8441424.1 hypothetical protein [Rhodobacter sp.]